jgi:hypothetical protein
MITSSFHALCRECINIWNFLEKFLRIPDLHQSYIESTDPILYSIILQCKAEKSLFQSLSTGASVTANENKEWNKWNIKKCQKRKTVSSSFEIYYNIYISWILLFIYSFRFSLSAVCNPASVTEGSS